MDIRNGISSHPLPKSALLSSSALSGVSTNLRPFLLSAISLTSRLRACAPFNLLILAYKDCIVTIPCLNLSYNFSWITSIRHYLIFIQSSLYPVESDILVYSSEVVGLFLLWSLSMFHNSITGLANDAQPDFAISRTSPSKQACFPLHFISRLLFRPKFFSTLQASESTARTEPGLLWSYYLITLSLITSVAVTPLNFQNDTWLPQQSSNYLRRYKCQAIAL